MYGSTVPVPPFETRTTAWRQSFRGGTAADRMLSKIAVSIPPDIASFNPHVAGPIAVRCEEAVRAIAALDATAGAELAPLATLLLRAESVASSKIENESASTADYIRALHGIKANASAVAMASATGALNQMLNGDISAAAVTWAHRRLMADDSDEAPHAGAWRTMQNWIEGSDYSPRGASYVPPPPDLVNPLMNDLLTFANRTDLPVIAQSAIAHAQFESIHPFTDGNGRIGRALAAAIIRYRGVAHHVVVPVASALVAKRSEYFAALTAYRNGDAAPIIEVFSHATIIASEEASHTAVRLRALPADWSEAADNPRAGSATAGVLAALLEHPVFTVDELGERLALSTPTAYRTVERLSGSGILRPLTNRTRNQVWGAGDLLDELDDLGGRIAARARDAN